MLATSSVFHGVVHSLRESAFMLVETLWPLVLGFSASGMIRSFVPGAAMTRSLGDHGPRAVARATAWGAMSSSCSYAATSMARSMVAKGADLVSAMAFMFASTNLVIELGVTMVVLLGWQFAAAEVLGGSVMVVLVALTGGLVLGGAVQSGLRRRLASSSDSAPQVGHDTQVETRSTTRSGSWAEAARYSLADVRMLWRELAVGYLMGGALAALVPTRWWDALFLHGHGLLTTVDNALVGPLVAVVSCVCSVGNVPLAAALWNGGISFGGVVSFIFADLITLPLLFVYRRYYGTRLTVRLTLWFWVLMSVAGLVVEAVARASGLVPSHHLVTVASPRFSWDATTALDLVAVGALVGLVWLARRPVSGTGSATDPVCGMPVSTGDDSIHVELDGHHFWFCSDHCAATFAARRRPSVSEPQGGASGGGR